MNARRERKLLEGIGNNLILSGGLVFQQLENVQSMEDELKNARNDSERLAQEKDQVSTALESEKAKVITLTQEKILVLEAKKKYDEEKLKALKE